MTQQTNATQLKLLVEFMEKHDALAKNSLQKASNGRAKKKQLWTKLTGLLNNNGPPIKATKGWQKVWTDYMYNAKRKLNQRIRSFSKTGGGPYDAVPISHMEERIIAAAKIKEHVTGIPGATSHGSNADGPSSSTARQADEEFIDECFRAMSSTDSSSSDEENKTPSETESPRQEIRSDAESEDEAPQTSNKSKCADPKVKRIEKEIEKQEKFQNEMLRLLKESNEIGQKKLQLLEKQVATEVQYKKMKVQVLELDLEKVKCEIALLKRKALDK